MEKFITHLNVTENITSITLINIPVGHDYISRIFTCLAEKKINVDMISQTSPIKGNVNISFTLEDDDLIAAIQTLKTLKNEINSLRIEVNSNNTKFSLYCEKMPTTPGLAAKSMCLLTDNNIEIKMITTSEVDISYLLYASDQEKAFSIFNKSLENN